MMQRTQISLSDAERTLLDEEAARSGRSISALIREAVMLTFGAARDVDADLRAIDFAFGSWGDVELDGEAHVEALRSGRRLDRDR